KTVSLQLKRKINQGTATDVVLDWKATVEGWKLVEGTLNLTGVINESTLDLEFSKTKTTNVYMDDLRIFPAEATMKSYVYDYRNLRLVAELDANHLATVYECDDEGILTRVKKETHRGVVMMKESRQCKVKRPEGGVR